VPPLFALLVASAITFLPSNDVAGALYCPSGVYVIEGNPFPLKAFRKGSLLRLALPYRRPDWRLKVKYVFRRGESVRIRLKHALPFPQTQIGLVKICMNDGRSETCKEAPKQAWQLYWDEKTRTLWINLTHKGPLKAVRVKLSFGEGDCGGYLRYEAKKLPW